MSQPLPYGTLRERGSQKSKVKSQKSKVKSQQVEKPHPHWLESRRVRYGH